LAGSVIIKARCRIFEPNYRIIRAQFDLDAVGREAFGEYVLVNILREHGVLQDARWYEVVFNPLNLRR